VTTKSYTDIYLEKSKELNKATKL